MTKRLFALLLAMTLVVSMLPVGVMAEGTGTSGEEVVQKAGVTEVANCADFVAAMESGGNIRLTGSFELTAMATVPAGKTVVLDLNDQTIHSNDGETYHITNNGNLTIRDSGKNGAFTVNAFGKSANVIGVDNYGDLTIESGKISVTSNNRGAYPVYSSGPSVTITGGTLESIYNKSSGVYSAYALTLGGTDSVATISGGTFITTSNATNTGTRCAPIALRSGSNIQITITGGDFTSTRTVGNNGASIFKNDGADNAKLIVKGGTYSVSNAGTDRLFQNVKGYLEVSGGTFKYDGTAFSKNTKLTVTGGTFLKQDGTKNDISTYLAEGYAQNDQGVVAQEVSTSEALVAAMAKDGNIRLTGSFELTAMATVPAGKTVVLDLNDQTIHSNDGETYHITNNGNLTIRDSGKNGAFTVNASGKSANVIGVDNYGDLTIESGKISVTSNNRGAYPVYSSGPSVTITGGTLEAVYNKSSGIYSPYTLALGGTDSVATISGGTITATSNATSTSTRCAPIMVRSGSNIQITVTGGEFISTRTVGANGASILKNDGADNAKLIVKGGTYSVSNAGTDRLFQNVKGYLEVSGGTFKYDGTAFSKNTKLTVTGGTFLKQDGTKNDISGFLGEDYIQDDSGLVTTAPEEPEHSHKLCNDANCADHAAVEFEAWTSTDSLPKSGNYYLTADVQLKSVHIATGELNLCLNGFTVKAPANERSFALNPGLTLSVTDCTNNGKITGGVRNWGGVINVNAGATFNLYGGQLTGNTNKTATGGDGQGGAVYLSAGSETAVGGTFNLYGGSINGNTAYKGGAVYAGKFTVFNMYGGSITDNVANNSGGAILLGTSASFNMYGGEISGNTSAIEGGGITLTNSTISFSGNVVVQDNLAGEVASNVYIKAGLIAVGTMGANAKVGISMATPTSGTVLSTALNGVSVNDSFLSDDENFEISVKNDKLHLTEKIFHKHDLDNCEEHDEEVNFLAWEATDSLPKSGNYYLTADVQLKAVHTPSGDLNLCLNGFTIQAPANDRSFALNAGITLSITDHANAGKITGGVRNWGGVINVNAGATFNLYGGQLTGNKSKDVTSGDGQGGAVYLSAAKENLAGGVFNMYGGIISNNEAYRGGAVYMTKNTTFNLYGGTISNNIANNRSGAIYTGNTAVINIYGGEITGNTGASSGGAISATSQSVLTMTGGKITGNTGKSGGAIILEGTGTKMVLSGGEISGNNGTYGAAIYAAIGTIFEMTGGVIEGNTASNPGGAMLLQRATATLAGGEIKNNTTASSGGGVEIEGATVTLSGTKITGNTAVNGGGIYIANNGADYQPSVILAGGEITGNTATGIGGGVATKDDKYIKLELSGDLVIQNNTAGGKTSNLYLAGEGIFTLGTMGANAKVGLSALRISGAMSAQTDTDVSANFTSDNSTLKVIFLDKTVYLQPTDGHVHCLCNDKSSVCNHEDVIFTAWSDPKNLPTTSGSYYLTVDVKLSAVRNVSKNINICLNGHTITAPANDRTFALNEGYTLSVTDCGSTGKITGGVRNYGGVINVNQGATFNLYGGSLTGNTVVDLDNSNKGRSGAVFLTKEAIRYKVGEEILPEKPEDGVAYEEVTIPGGVFNMYGGSITENKANRGGAIYLNDGSTFNMYGGIISNNTAVSRGGAICNDGKCAINIYGGKITGNTGKGGGAISVYHATVVTITGGEISYNKSTGAGGGILLESKNSKLVLKGGAITGNSGTSGGGIYMGINTILEMTGGTISYNAANKYGGGIYMQQCTGTIRGGSISYNRAKESGAQAAGLKVDGSTLNIYGGTIHGNYFDHEKNSGGAAIATYKTTENKNGVTITHYTTINMYGGTISGHIGRSGGAMQLLTQTTFNMHGGTFQDNEAINDGGASAMYSGSIFNVYGGQFLNNKATKSGGALYYGTGCSGEVKDAIATGNSCGTDGGFLHAYGLTTKIVMKNMKIYGNTAAGYAGGVAMMMQSDLDMDDCELYENTAKRGGALYMAHKTTGSVDNVKVYNNSASDLGGGLYFDVGSTVTCTNVEITGNTSDKNGGGLVSRGNLHLKECLIDSNTSGESGGGIATNSAWTYDDTYTNGYVNRGQGMIIENCVISNNTCALLGGGAFLKEKNWNAIIDSTFTGNTSGQGGSALYVKDDLKVVGMTVTGNTSQNDGYAVWYDYNKFDGISYIYGIFEMGGNVIIKDNQGGDMMLCENVVLCNVLEGYGKDTYYNVTLSGGLLTNRVLGEYNYEGGNLSYTVTYGTRSYDEPEVEAPVQEQPEDATTEPDATTVTEPEDKDTGLYVGVGAIAGVIVIAAIVLVIVQKKKSRAGQE